MRPGGSSFWVHWWRDRPVFALPSAPRAMRRAAWRYYPYNAPRQELARIVLRTADALGVARPLVSTSENPLSAHGIDLQAWLEDLRQALGPLVASMAVAWPPVQRSTGRLYAYLLDARGKCVGFAKLALGDHDQRAIAGEALALRTLATVPHPSFHAPALMHEGTVGGCYFIVAQPLEEPHRRLHFRADSWDSFGRRCKQEFAGQPVTLAPAEIEIQPWWKRFLNAMPTDSNFEREAIAAAREPVEVCRTHGDFLGHNFRLAAGHHIWIYDWEEYTPHGPLLADEIAFFLCVQRYGLNRPEGEVNRLFKQTYLADRTVRRNAVLALAFLCGTDAAMARIVARQAN